jgi:thiosulfate/3-mercaptopyruvate sulfurtransferase
VGALSPLIAPDALRARLGEPGLTLIDCTSTWTGGPEIKLGGHIPGAVALDIDAVSDKSNPLPHMLPSPAAFEAFARAAGVRNVGAVVVYDRLGLVSAPRGWWMFRVMGLPSVQVLDGGLPAWIASGGAVADGPAAARGPTPGDFVARLEPKLLADRERVAKALDGREQVVDVRAAARFAGTAPEPRPGMRSGHMPGALNAPWASLETPDGRMLPPMALRAALLEAGVTFDKTVLTSCGSGVTACIAALALESLGHRDWAVYDGSWSEWGSRTDTPVVADGTAA